MGKDGRWAFKTRHLCTKEVKWNGWASSWQLWRPDFLEAKLLDLRKLLLEGKGNVRFPGNHWSADIHVRPCDPLRSVPKAIQPTIHAMGVKVVTPSTSQMQDPQLHAATESLRKVVQDSNSLGVYFDVNLFMYSRPIKKQSSSSQNEFLVKCMDVDWIFRICGYRGHL